MLCPEPVLLRAALTPPRPSRQVGEEHVGGLASHPSEGEEAAFTDAPTTTDGFADAPLTDAFGGASAMHAFGEAPAANGGQFQQLPDPGAVEKAPATGTPAYGSL